MPSTRRANMSKIHIEIDTLDRRVDGVDTLSFYVENHGIIRHIGPPRPTKSTSQRQYVEKTLDFRQA